MGFHQNNFLETVNLLENVFELNIPELNSWEKLVNALEESKNSFLGDYSAVERKFNFFSVISWLELIETEYVPMARSELRPIKTDAERKNLIFLKFLESFEVLLKKTVRSLVEDAREFSEESLERLARASVNSQGCIDFFKQTLKYSRSKS